MRCPWGEWKKDEGGGLEIVGWGVYVEGDGSDDLMGVGFGHALSREDDGVICRFGFVGW